MVPFKTTSLTTTQSAIIGATLSAQGIIYAQGGNSSLWNSTFTTVQANSATWEESAEILPTVTNYLSTNNVLVNSLSVSSVQIRTRPTLNVFIGDSTTGNNNATGNHNFVFGLSAGNALTSGTNNVFIGNCAGRVNSSGRYNNFLGSRAGYNNISGCDNNFFGTNAGCNNSTGCSNNFFGVSTGCGNTTGNFNNFLGNSAGRNNTTGSSNNFLGVQAGRCNTTGGSNNFLGNSAGRYNTTGNFNNFLGDQAGCCNTTGINNNFLGYNAGRVNTTGGWNTFLGVCAGFRNISGSFNHFLGPRSGSYNTTGCYNNFIGYRAGCNNTTGHRNTFLGVQAGCTNTTGSNNTIIGSLANVATNNLSNVIVLGTGAIATESHQVVLSTANVLFRSTGNTFEIGASNLQDNLTVFGTISSTGTVFASAANISGDITANRIQATVKNFYIDHPTKPGKHLVYSSLETPYNGIQLTGEGELVNGYSAVELPDYISKLIHPDSVHIQLTNHKHSKPLYVDSIEIEQNRFTVKSDSWTSKLKTLKFFWLLNGVRRDIEPLQTEV